MVTPDRIAWLMVLLFPAIVLAQSADPVCGFERVHQRQLATDSRYQALVGRAVNPTKANGAATDEELYIIPVVFVVYHVGEAVGTGSNSADATLIEQLALLNRYYAAEAPFSNGVNSHIRFVLAQRSPTCQASSGIVRVDARSAAGYEANGVTNYTDAFRLLPLSSEYGSSQADRFVFIRVVRNLTFAAGFATFGGGIFVDAELINNAQNGNTLLAHEMGHVLYLYHTFQGSSASNGTFVCPANSNPALDGDEVADTAPHKQFDPPSCSE